MSFVVVFITTLTAGTLSKILKFWLPKEGEAIWWDREAHYQKKKKKRKEKKKKNGGKKKHKGG